MFEVVDVASGIPELEQSTIDCVVDAGLLDHLIITQVHDVIDRLPANKTNSSKLSF